MPYTPNVPQGNQQIASTQPLIQQNFGFIQTDARVEHIFNGNTGPLAVPQAEGTHIQVSMPNQNLKGAGTLPSGTNGQIYVSSGQLIYNNNVGDFNVIQNLQRNGSVVIGPSPASATILPAGSYMGIVSVFRTSDNAYQFIQFWLNGATLVTNNMASGGTSAITLVLDGSNNLNLRNGSGSGNTFKYQIFYQVGAP